ncbi:tetratricopeptide repeat protein [compost metagenome]
MNGGMEGNSEKNWLVRSSTRILGPFNLTEIKELLVSRQISIIDEVRSTQARWSYIRENKDFLEVVKNVREQLDTLSENTMTQSVAQHTTTTTRTDVLQSDDLTPTPTPTPPTRRMSVEPSLKDVTPMAESSIPRSTGGPARSYGASSDSRVLNQISNRSKVIRAAVLGVIGLVLVVAGLQVFRKGKQQEIGYEDLLNQALKYRSLGLYDKSLGYYKKATALKEPDFESQVQMAPVLIAEDRQTLAGRRVLEKAISTPGRSRNELMAAYIGVGLSYLMDGDLKEAEDTLQKALGYEPSNFDARMNMAIVQMRKGNYGEASREFSALSRRAPQSTLALLGKAVAVVETSKTNPDAHSLNEVIHDIQRMGNKTQYLKHELTLLLIYANTLLGNMNEAHSSIVQFLSQRPGESSRYIKNLFIDWRMTQWDYLERFCADIYSRQPLGPQTRSLRASCLMEVNRDGESQKLLEEALAESPRDPYVLLTQAMYLKKVGRVPEALAILKMRELSALVIRDQISGSICLASGDVSCAQKTFAGLYQKNQKDAFTFYGLSWVANQSKDRARAYEYVRAGLQAEPNYIPLLELRDELESD